jgi:hypothetical protein
VRKLRLWEWGLGGLKPKGIKAEIMESWRVESNRMEFESWNLVR